jgi:hypothetical protein
VGSKEGKRRQKRELVFFQDLAEVFNAGEQDNEGGPDDTGGEKAFEGINKCHE